MGGRLRIAVVGIPDVAIVAAAVAVAVAVASWGLRRDLTVCVHSLVRCAGVPACVGSCAGELAGRRASERASVSVFERVCVMVGGRGR